MVDTLQGGEPADPDIKQLQELGIDIGARLEVMWDVEDGNTHELTSHVRTQRSVGLIRKSLICTQIGEHRLRVLGRGCPNASGACSTSGGVAH
eukprot:1181708-Prorocentrum_minimum.AAC.2